MWASTVLAIGSFVQSGGRSFPAPDIFVQERKIDLCQAAVDVVGLFRRKRDRTMAIRMVAFDYDFLQNGQPICVVANWPYLCSAGAEFMLVINWELLDAEHTSVRIVSTQIDGDDARESAVDVERLIGSERNDTVSVGMMTLDDESSRGLGDGSCWGERLATPRP